jgi:hypothetical protein
MRLGKQAFTVDHRDYRFADAVDVAAVLPSVPKTFGNELGIQGWGMLGNDEYGDCTCAGACHEHMDWNHAAGRSVNFTDADALGLYSAVTGFNPDDPSTDQGAQVRDVLAYRKKHGVKDSTGKLHKIDAYLAIEAGNVQELLCAAYIFGAVGIGFAFPDYAMGQFNAGKPWSYLAGQPEPTEGHYVPVVAHRGGDIEVITWAKKQKMTAGFYTHYNDEAWAIYSRELLNAKGASPLGFVDAQLEAFLKTKGV